MAGGAGAGRAPGSGQEAAPGGRRLEQPPVRGRTQRRVRWGGAFYLVGDGGSSHVCALCFNIDCVCVCMCVCVCVEWGGGVCVRVFVSAFRNKLFVCTCHSTGSVCFWQCVCL